MRCIDEYLNIDDCGQVGGLSHSSLTGEDSPRPNTLTVYTSRLPEYFRGSRLPSTPELQSDISNDGTLQFSQGMSTRDYYARYKFLRRSNLHILELWLTGGECFVLPR